MVAVPLADGAIRSCVLWAPADGILVGVDASAIRWVVAVDVPITDDAIRGRVALMPAVE